eukprot:s4904_g3.t1
MRMCLPSEPAPESAAAKGHFKRACRAFRGGSLKLDLARGAVCGAARNSAVPACIRLLPFAPIFHRDTERARRTANKEFEHALPPPCMQGWNAFP